MHRLLSYCAMLGLTVVSHAEDGGLTGQAVATASAVSPAQCQPQQQLVAISGLGGNATASFVNGALSIQGAAGTGVATRRR